MAAVKAYAEELEKIANIRSLNVDDLLSLAGSSKQNHEDLDRALRLSSLIYALRK